MVHDVDVWFLAQMKACSVLMMNLVLVCPSGQALSEDAAGIILNAAKIFHARNKLCFYFLIIGTLFLMQMQPSSNDVL